jgi:hypothetical protein
MDSLEEKEWREARDFYRALSLLLIMCFGLSVLINHGLLKANRSLHVRLAAAEAHHAR